MKRFLAAVGTAAVILTGATACSTDSPNQGYMQVWEHGRYTYVPYSYYLSHRSYYSNSSHPPHRKSSNYVTTHHVKVTHKTTTTVHKDGSRTVKKHTTTRKFTTRKRTRR